MTEQALNNTPEIIAVRRALNCLYLEVPERVGDDVKAKVEAAISALHNHAGTLQGALESSASTNKILAYRLEHVAHKVPLAIHALTEAQIEADKDEPNDGYEALYNTADSVGTDLARLMRIVNGEEHE